jgi:hypothetical protein
MLLCSLLVLSTLFFDSLTKSLAVDEVLLSSPHSRGAGIRSSTRLDGLATTEVMEVVGFVAALPTLIKTAARVSQGAIALCKDVYGAPEEVGRVVSQLLVIQAQLQLLHDTRSGAANYVGTPQARQLLHDAFFSAEKIIKAIHEACQKRCRKLDFVARLQWAILDRSTINNLLDELHHTESHLSVVLQLLSMYASYLLSRAVPL